MSTANSIEVLDLDTLLPQSKIVKLDGRKFDVTELPLGLLMKVIQLQEGLDEMESKDKLQTMADIMADVFRLTDPEMTTEWLMDHMGLEKLTALTDFIIKDMKAVVEEDADASPLADDQLPEVTDT